MLILALDNRLILFDSFRIDVISNYITVIVGHLVIASRGTPKRVLIMDKPG